MTNTICLNQDFSTTKLLTKDKPIIKNRPEDKFETVLLLPKGENRKGEGGLRTKGYFKKSYKDQPLISIVTVVFNGKEYLEETIQSIINQTYNNVEYMIIDGGSVDGTLDIIRKYEDKIDYWVSEPDKGLYAAMNKGIDLATGNWINFMNTGDGFVENIDILNFIDNNYDVLYGDCIVDKGVKKNKVGKNPKKLKYGSCFCHQAMFFKTEVLRKNKFDENLQIGADYDQFFRIYNRGYKFKRIDENIAHFSSGGVSDIKRLNVYREYFKICMKFKNCSKVNLFYRFIRELVKIFIKKIR